MREGRVASEQDFFDMKSMLDQLQKAKKKSVDDYAPGTDFHVGSECFLYRSIEFDLDAIVQPEVELVLEIAQ